MSTLETIVEDLKSPPALKLQEAALLTHRLRENTRSERLAAIERSTWILSAEEGAKLERVIAEGCGKIDARDW